MPHFSDTALDQLLTYIATADNMYIVTSAVDVTNFSAVSTNPLFDITLTPGDGNDFTIADDPTNGRRVTTDAKSSQAAANSGDTNKAVLTVGTTVIGSWDVASLSVVQGSNYNVPSLYTRIPDPVNV
jgi:hypothetical protein